MNTIPLGQSDLQVTPGITWAPRMTFGEQVDEPLQPAILDRAWSLVRIIDTAEDGAPVPARAAATAPPRPSSGRWLACRPARAPKVVLASRVAEPLARHALDPRRQGFDAAADIPGLLRSQPAPAADRLH